MKLPAVGTWIQSGSAVVVEVLDGQFDFLVIDQEHAPVCADTLANLIRAARKSPVFVRLGEPSPYQARQALDWGAAGVIAPMIEDEQDAAAVVRACYYAPVGNRGLGHCRANRYGEEIHAGLPAPDLTVLQIETARGYRRLRPILRAVADFPVAVMVGPLDLALSLGVGPDDKSMHEVYAEITDQCRRRNVPYGLHIVHPDQATLTKCLAAGAQFMAHGTDLEFLRLGLRTARPLVSPPSPPTGE